VTVSQSLSVIRQFANDTQDYWEADESLEVGNRLQALAGEPGHYPELDQAFQGLINTERQLIEWAKVLYHRCQSGHPPISLDEFLKTHWTGEVLKFVDSADPWGEDNAEL